jgi:hypothetical protein
MVKRSPIELARKMREGARKFKNTLRGFKPKRCGSIMLSKKSWKRIAKKVKREHDENGTHVADFGLEQEKEKGKERILPPILDIFFCLSPSPVDVVWSPSSPSY